MTSRLFFVDVKLHSFRSLHDDSQLPTKRQTKELRPLAKGDQAQLQWEARCGDSVYFHRQRLCLTKVGPGFD